MGKLPAAAPAADRQLGAGGAPASAKALGPGKSDAAPAPAPNGAPAKHPTEEELLAEFEELERHKG